MGGTEAIAAQAHTCGARAIGDIVEDRACGVAWLLGGSKIVKMSDKTEGDKPATPEEIRRAHRWADEQTRRQLEFKAHGVDGRPMSVDFQGDDPLLELLKFCHGADRASGVRADIFDVKRDRLYTS